MLKTIFDIILSFILILLLGWLLLLVTMLATFDTQSFGIFIQTRIGQYGKKFKIIKIKTIHPKTQRISAFGQFLRKSKIDELPQLINILLGDMSFVGPRPDLEGYYDQLEGEARKILELKPGLTSTASIKYSNEEALLSRQSDPLRYNDEVIFPDKVKLNLEYYYTRSFFVDLNIILKTLLR